jgi:hypothetical protein
LLNMTLYSGFTVVKAVLMLLMIRSFNWFSCCWELHHIPPWQLDVAPGNEYKPGLKSPKSDASPVDAIVM